MLRPTRRFSAFCACALVPLLMLFGVGCESAGGGRSTIDGAWLITLDDGDAIPAGFTGSDADATERADGDTVTALRLPLADEAERIRGDVEFDQAEAASDAVGSAPGLAVSADGRMLATAGPVSLDPTSRIRVRLFTLDEDGMSLLGAVEMNSGADQRVALAFHPFEPLLAVLQHGAPSLRVIELLPERGGIGGPFEVDLSGSLAETDEPSSMAWHPSGRFIGFTLAAANEAAFFELRQSEEDGAWEISSWGNRVATGMRPSRCVFSPDGRFFLTADLAVEPGPGVEVVTASGSVSVIRVADSMSAGAVHERIAKVRTAHQPREMALSRSGRLLALASHRREDLEIARSDRLTGGRIMLYGFDTLSGELIRSDEARTTPLPSGLAFDVDASHLLVADYLSDEVQVWRVAGDQGLGLEFTGLTIGTGVRPHDLVVAPEPAE